jgi:proton-translocating NADH-quinone oxidoreductase chain N
MMQTNTALIWLIALPLFAFPLVYFVGRISVRLLHNPHGTRVTRWLTLAVLAAEFVPLTILTQAQMAGQAAAEIHVHQITLRMDGIGLLLATVTLALGSLVTLFSWRYMAHEKGEGKYYALLLAMIGTIIGMGCTQDLFNLWVWFEGMSLSAIILVTYYRTQAAALEAGFKYLIQSVAGSVMIILGISLVLTQSGTLDLAELRTIVPATTTGMLAAGGLFIAGFGVKAALVPMYTWLPDAHSQAPSGVSAMLSGVVIEAGLIAMLRALMPLARFTAAWGPILLGFAVLNMLVGNLMALRQTQVKRLLAYSSASQMGYILFGIGLSMAFGQADGATGGFFHIINHALMKGGAFLGAGALMYAMYIARGEHGPLVLDDLNGAARRYPLTAFAFSVAVLALGAMPPLAGFMSEWQILLAGAKTTSPLMLALVLFTALNSLLSLGYYAPMVNRLYRKQAAEKVTDGAPVPAGMAIPLVLLTLGTVLLGVFPNLVNWLTGPAAAQIAAAFGG